MYYRGVGLSFYGFSPRLVDFADTVLHLVHDRGFWTSVEPAVLDMYKDRLLRTYRSCKCVCIYGVVLLCVYQYSSYIYLSCCTTPILYYSIVLLCLDNMHIVYIFPVYVCRICIYAHNIIAITQSIYTVTCLCCYYNYHHYHQGSKSDPTPSVSLCCATCCMRAPGCPSTASPPARI